MLYPSWTGLLVIVIILLAKLFWNFRGMSLLFRAAQVDRMDMARARTERDRAIVIAHALVQQITLADWHLRRSVERLGTLKALTPEEQTQHYESIDRSLQNTWCDGQSFKFFLPMLKVSQPWSSEEVAQEYGSRMRELTTLREAILRFDRFFGRYRHQPAAKTP